MSEWAPTRYDVMVAEDIYFDDETMMKLHENDVEIVTDDEDQPEVPRVNRENESLRGKYQAYCRLITFPIFTICKYGMAWQP